MAEPIPTREQLIAELEAQRRVALVARATKPSIVPCPSCSPDSREGCPSCLGIGCVEGGREADWAKIEADDELSLMVDLDYVKGGQMVPRFTPKLKLLEMSAKLAGYLSTTKVEVTTPAGGSFYDTLTAEELAEKAAQLKELFDMGAIPTGAPAG
jgi:hypothetical protein